MFLNHGKQDCTALFSCSSKVKPLSKIPVTNGQQESTQHSADLHQGLIISPVSHYFHRQTLYCVDDSMGTVAKVHRKILSVHDYRVRRGGHTKLLVQSWLCSQEHVVSKRNYFLLFEARRWTKNIVFYELRRTVTKINNFFFTLLGAQQMPCQPDHSSFSVEKLKRKNKDTRSP